MASVNDKEEFKPYPEHVAVIGGGRWARVLAEVLCSIAPLTTRISICSPHNAMGMSEWISVHGFEKRIQVSSDFPKLMSGKSNAIIVANAARDREKAIEWALSEDVPVLVEKPLTLDFATTQRMVDLAASRQIYFAAAHIFLFARYVDTFAKQIADGGEIQSIHVRWMDPQFESRHGEVKSYDPGLPIYADWLPHIVSMLGALTPSNLILCENLRFFRGGSHVDFDLMLEGIPCTIQMVRNGDNRQRIIEVISSQKKTVLDFATEPGNIISGSTTLCGDMDWEVKPKPVAAMLGAFLQGAAGGSRDQRLDIAIGLRASQAIDQVSSSYCVAQSEWLSKALLMLHNGGDSDLRYALSEILHVEDPYSPVPISQRIDYVCWHIKGRASLLNCELIGRPIELIKLILEQGKLSSYS